METGVVKHENAPARNVGKQPFRQPGVHHLAVAMPLERHRADKLPMPTRADDARASAPRPRDVFEDPRTSRGPCVRPAQTVVNAAFINEIQRAVQGDGRQPQEEKTSQVFIPLGVAHDFFFNVISSWRSLFQMAAWLTPKTSARSFCVASGRSSTSLRRASDSNVLFRPGHGFGARLSPCLTFRQQRWTVFVQVMKCWAASACVPPLSTKATISALLSIEMVRMRRGM